jgi:hypothetical protein
MSWVALVSVTVGAPGRGDVQQTNGGGSPRGAGGSGGSPTEGSRVGRTVIFGGVLAVLAVFAVVTVGIGAVVDNYAVGAVLGAFCAMWGGIGFGVMLAGAVALLREDEPPQQQRLVRAAPAVDAREPAVVGGSPGVVEPRRP